MRCNEPQLAACGLHSDEQRKALPASSSPQVYPGERKRLPSSLCKPSLRAYFDWEDSWNEDYAKRPLLLDLFCGGGGAGFGYYLAGFQVLGIDSAPQPRYPFRFLQADALEFLARIGPDSGWDLIHASPPCQQYSRARVLHGRSYPDLVAAVRSALQRTGVPYVIENVVGAPLHHPIQLCGLNFGLKVFRHRLFESSEFLLEPPHLSHGERQIGRDGFCCVAGHGDSGRGRVPADHRTVGAWRRAMGIDWMTRDELSQAIPPAYCEFIGRQTLGV